MPTKQELKQRIRELTSRSEGMMSWEIIEEFPTIPKNTIFQILWNLNLFKVQIETQRRLHYFQTRELAEAYLVRENGLSVELISESGLVKISVPNWNPKAKTERHIILRPYHMAELRKFFDSYTGDKRDYWELVEKRNVFNEKVRTKRPSVNLHRTKLDRRKPKQD